MIDNHAHDAMIAADAILLASGTAALEAMLAKRPMVVAYRVAPLTYRIVMGLHMLELNRYSLPNVLAGRDLVPELMQDACTPAALADALLPSLTRASPAAAARRRIPAPAPGASPRREPLGSQRDRRSDRRDARRRGLDRAALRIDAERSHPHDARVTITAC